MIAVDTSVAVAALAAWHLGHEEARRAAAEALIPAHARLETYSVLTRMPPPHRLAPSLVAYLLARCPEETVVPSPELSRGLVERCREAQVSGGAVYDALVGLTAAEASLTLLTRDARAAGVYRRVGIPFDLVR